MTDLLDGAIETVEQTIRIAAGRDDGVYTTSLLRRLASLREPRTPRGKEEYAIFVAHIVWCSYLSRSLLPEVGVDVLRELRQARARHGLAEADDPWLRIDDARFIVKRYALAAELHPFIVAAVRSCRQYERTRRSGHLSEAVRTLEAAEAIERRRLRPRPQAQACDAETKCLGEALKARLPASAFRFFVKTVRSHIASLLARPRARPRSDRRRMVEHEDQWLSLGEWAVQGWNEEWTPGTWFVASLQVDYDLEMEDDRQRKEEKARKDAEWDRQMAEWQARREDEARQADAEAEEVRRLEEARRPLQQQLPRPDDADRRRETQEQEEARAEAVRNERLLRETDEQVRRRIEERDLVQQSREVRKARDAERRRVESEAEERRAAFEAKMSAKRAPRRIQSRPIGDDHDAAAAHEGRR